MYTINDARLQVTQNTNISVVDIDRKLELAVDLLFQELHNATNEIRNLKSEINYLKRKLNYMNVDGR